MLKGTWPHSIPSQHKGRGGGGTSGLLVIALCGVSLNSQEHVTFIRADGSADRSQRRRDKRAEAERWKAGMRLIQCFPLFQKLAVELVQRSEQEKHMAVFDKIRFRELPDMDSTGWSGGRGPDEHNKLRLPWVVSASSRSPGRSVLLCARCVFFNYTGREFVQFHTCPNMQQLFLISDNDSLKYK